MSSLSERSQTPLRFGTVGGERRRWQERWPGDPFVITIVSLEMTARNGATGSFRDSAFQVFMCFILMTTVPMANKNSDHERSGPVYRCSYSLRTEGELNNRYFRTTDNRDSDHVTLSERYAPLRPGTHTASSTASTYASHSLSHFVLLYPSNSSVPSLLVRRTYTNPRVWSHQRQASAAPSPSSRWCPCDSRSTN